MQGFDHEVRGRVNKKEVCPSCGPLQAVLRYLRDGGGCVGIIPPPRWSDFQHHVNSSLGLEIYGCCKHVEPEVLRCYWRRVLITADGGCAVCRICKVGLRKEMSLITKLR